MSDEVHTEGFIEDARKKASEYTKLVSRDKYHELKEENKRLVQQKTDLETDRTSLAQRIHNMNTWIHTLYKAAMDLKEDATIESVNLKQMEHNIISRRDEYKKEIKELEHTIRENDEKFALDRKYAAAGWIKEKEELLINFTQTLSHDSESEEEAEPPAASQVPGGPAQGRMNPFLIPL